MVLEFYKPNGLKKTFIKGISKKEYNILKGCQSGQTDDGLTKLNVNLQNETVCLIIDQMAELFQRDKSTISRHIHKIFKEGELVREATVAFFATVQIEGLIDIRTHR